MRGLARHRVCFAALALTLGLSTLGRGAGLNREEAIGLYAEAKALFKEANEKVTTAPRDAKELYGRAALRFERLVGEGGIHNGKLYYNIGNAYFRMGDLGRAILNYRRAQVYVPNDANLIQNLAYARSKRLDPFEEKQEKRILRTLLFWHYDFSKSTRSAIFAVCFVVFWVGAMIRLFAAKAAPRWALISLGVLAALFLGSLATETWLEGRRPPGVIVASVVVARKGDGEMYQPSFKEPLHTGTEFALLEDRADWRHIELPDGRRCWIPAKSAELVPVVLTP